jgi:flagellar biosynthetic protein FliR
MMAVGPDTVLTVFVLFCRIGAVLILMPGFSSRRIPVRVRLFMSFSITLALTPLLYQDVAKTLGDASSPTAILRLFVSETMAGLLMGFLARIFFGALETLSGAIAMSIGLTSALAGPMEDHEPLPAIANFITFVATVLVFVTNLHWEIVRGIVASYSLLPVSGLFDVRFGLVQVSDCLTKSFLAALRIASPFIVYALVTNFALGLASRLVPQIPVYFITVPAVLAGGLALWYLIYLPFFQIFNEEFLTWIAGG